MPSGEASTKPAKAEIVTKNVISGLVSVNQSLQVATAGSTGEVDIVDLTLFIE